LAARKPSRARSAKPAGVADSALFQFAPEAANEKPHYHEHRARLRKRFEDGGAAALADYELLELFLFRTIPRQDTKPLAKALLAKFGDIGAVAAAPVARIAEVPGAGPSVAQDLRLLQALMERAARTETAKRPLISSSSQLHAYCRVSMAHAPREQFRVLFLDAKNQLIADEIMNEGTVDHAPVYPREIARRALELSAASVILVHNHPSGDPKPSAADIEITQDIVAATETIGVRVHDHIVVGRDSVASLKSLGML
jgi:DNA repair protein RadC